MKTYREFQVGKGTALYQVLEDKDEKKVAQEYKKAKAELDRDWPADKRHLVNYKAGDDHGLPDTTC